MQKRNEGRGVSMPEFSGHDPSPAFQQRFMCVSFKFIETQ
ncbi:hypothetical protein PAMC26577_07010 [Caballeronia sordidicola]|uniref:Uncharacterized protein n=1 Tax=Caballeronia sordidicola TaxID=196367 RepID=A0A242N2R4_CABSO|nr:hypothetical protein PAMC26577_07010 [Caballeronia sordidicola]